MRITTDFATGSGKSIGRLHDGHFSIEMRRDKAIYENYFHFRIDAEDFEGEAVVDIYPDQDFLPESRRILDTHFSPAILWRSPEVRSQPIRAPGARTRSTSWSGTATSCACGYGSIQRRPPTSAAITRWRRRAGPRFSRPRFPSAPTCARTAASDSPPTGAISRA